MRAGWILASSMMVATIATPSSPHRSLMTGGSAAASPEWLALQKSMRKMHAEMMSARPSDSGDLDFVTLMLPHHRAAVEMAKTQLLYGTDPQMRRLAQEIVTEQQSEIELMQLWLEQRGPQK
jgi:uncharacterized protein (DUF305 family)